MKTENRLNNSNAIFKDLTGSLNSGFHIENIASNRGVKRSNEKHSSFNEDRTIWYYENPDTEEDFVIHIGPADKEITGLIQADSIIGWRLTFNLSFLNRYGPLANSYSRFSFMEFSRNGKLPITAADFRQVAWICRAMFKEYESVANDRFEMIASQFHMLLMLTNRFWNENVKEFKVLKTNINVADQFIFRRFLELLEKESENIQDCDSCTVADFSAKLAVTPNYLNAAVKRVSGNTALSFLHERVIRIAKSYLIKSSLTIKEVAYEMQFSEPTHFGAFFKKHTGITPAAFRKSYMS